MGREGKYGSLKENNLYGRERRYGSLKENNLYGEGGKVWVPEGKIQSEDCDHGRDAKTWVSSAFSSSLF